MDKIKIKSSFLKLSGYEFKIAVDKDIELSTEFLTLPVDTGKQIIHASLSFKNVIKVELLDNSEQKGAGLVLHVNNYMMRKLQQYLVPGSNKLMDYKSSYSQNKLIVFDILNCGHEDMHNIRLILASISRHNYIAQQTKKQNKNSKLVNSVQFVELISHNQWSVLVSMLANPGLILIKYG
uniref:Uncharacterized protein n=1 Tax=Meloidogyne enterolobii TaxID=390850 RepID=A0A6V7VHS7_MELEN|nr:unnamed protein product [Meloidogyne enterolobii]